MAARAKSRVLCGRKLAVDLQLDGERVSAVGLDVFRLPALGQAAASVLSANIAGADRQSSPPVWTRSMPC